MQNTAVRRIRVWERDRCQNLLRQRIRHDHLYALEGNGNRLAEHFAINHLACVSGCHVGDGLFRIPLEFESQETLAQLRTRAAAHIQAASSLHIRSEQVDLFVGEKSSLRDDDHFFPEDLALLVAWNDRQKISLVDQRLRGSQDCILSGFVVSNRAPLARMSILDSVLK